MADTDRSYLTQEGDMMDLIAYREYGSSSEATEMLYDYNYRIADENAEMPSGITVLLPPYTAPKLSTLIRLWD